MLGEGLIGRAGAAVIGIRMNADAATRDEESNDFDITRVHEFDKVL